MITNGINWLSDHWHHLTASVAIILLWVYRIDLVIHTLFTRRKIMTDTISQVVTIVEADIQAATASLPAITTGINMLAPIISLIPALKPYANDAQVLVKGLSAVSADLPDVIAKVQAADAAVMKLVSDFEAAAGITPTD